MPNTKTISPESRLIIGKSFSGRKYCEAKSVASPKAKTPSVCVMVTVNPKNAACLTVPREPTRYAPTIVLPCPGDIA